MDGRKIDGHRIIVDRELGRTKKTWYPRRLGGGKGEARRDRRDEQLIGEIKSQQAAEEPPQKAEESKDADETATELKQEAEVDGTSPKANGDSVTTLDKRQVENINGGGDVSSAANGDDKSSYTAAAKLQASDR